MDFKKEIYIHPTKDTNNQTETPKGSVFLYQWDSNVRVLLNNQQYTWPKQN